MMKRYVPIVLVFIFMSVASYVVIIKKNSKKVTQPVVQNIGTITQQKSCARPPHVLKRLGITRPVVINLTQKKYMGVAMHFGEKHEKVLHPEQWKQYEHFSTYASDEKGNIYLVPTPFISIRPTTFNLQKNIYKLDSKTGKLSIFMHFDDVHASSNNPYGMNAIAYDCEDKTLWVASIDESDYTSQKGVIYHVNPRTKEVLQKVEGFDVLTMAVTRSEKGKFLLVGSARDNGMYAYEIKNGKLSLKPEKLFELPQANQHIRRIRISGKNALAIQSIPFTYALIARTTKQDRMHHKVSWNEEKKVWIFKP